MKYIYILKNNLFYEKNIKYINDKYIDDSVKC